MARVQLSHECGWCHEMFLSYRALYCGADCRAAARRAQYDKRVKNERKLSKLTPGVKPPDDDSDLPLMLDPNAGRSEYEGTCHLCSRNVYVMWTPEEKERAKSQRCTQCQHGALWFVPVVATALSGGGMRVHHNPFRRVP